MKAILHIENKSNFQHGFAQLKTIVGCAILYTGALILMSNFFKTMI